ncbi:MAG: Dabb family protein [Maritimibacter sp.]
MIRHIVFFSAKDPQDAERIQKGLSILTRIPHADRLELALNHRDDPISDEIDVVVYGEFADLDALAAYKAHELYQISIARVRPLRELRFAVNFDSSAALTEEAAFE